MPSVKPVAPAKPVAEVHPSVLKAENAARLQRFAGLALLRLDESKASPAEISLFGKVKGSADAEALDKFLAHKTVVELFTRGVFFFGGDR